MFPYYHIYNLLVSFSYRNEPRPAPIANKSNIHGSPNYHYDKMSGYVSSERDYGNKGQRKDQRYQNNYDNQHGGQQRYQDTRHDEYGKW